MMETPEPYTVAPFKPLTPRAESAILAADADTLVAVFKHYLEAKARTLQAELNEVYRLLGRNTKRCPHCGMELK